MMDYEFSRLKLSLSSRLALAASCFAVGAALHYAFGWGLVPGIAAIALGYIPLHLKPVTNKPSDKGLEEWKPVSMAEVDRLADTLREAKKLRGRTAGSTGLMVGITAVALVAAFLSFISDANVSLAILDGVLFAVPAMYFGRVKVFVPADLSMKMPCFQAIFSEPLPDDVVLTPYLRFDKDAEGRDVPEDIRIMVEPRRKPADFVGMQMQATLNKGPNGNVPYLYAVALTKGKGDSYRLLDRVTADGYEFESGGDESWGTIVVRQQTSGSGYHTRPEDCVALLRLALRIMEKLPRGSAG
ncbi:MAG: hypothetical protein ABFC75_05500 [Rectinema sp.]